MNNNLNEDEQRLFIETQQDCIVYRILIGLLDSMPYC